MDFTVLLLFRLQAMFNDACLATDMLLVVQEVLPHPQLSSGNAPAEGRRGNDSLSQRQLSCQSVSERLPWPARVP